MPSMSSPTCVCASKISAPSGSSRASSPSQWFDSSSARSTASFTPAESIHAWEGGCRERVLPPVPDVLIFGDTLRSPELRHEVPLAIPGPVPLPRAERPARVAINSLEVPRVRDWGSTCHPVRGVRLGRADRGGGAAATSSISRSPSACRRSGSRRRSSRRLFPLELADHLRGARHPAGSDREVLRRRRRVKNGRRAGGDPPGAARGRGGDGRGPRPARRAPTRTATCSCSTASR